MQQRASGLPYFLVAVCLGIRCNCRTVCAHVYVSTVNYIDVIALSQQAMLWPWSRLRQVGRNV